MPNRLITVLILESGPVKGHLATHAGGRVCSLLRPLGTTLEPMEGVNTNLKDGPAARYGRLSGKHSQLGCSATTAACMRVMVGSHAAQLQGEGIVSTAQPMAPAVPRAPPASPPPIPTAGSVLGTFF